MARRPTPQERRDDALSRDRIVEEAITILDAEGESGLTFRALTTRLKTGAGAIYWHVANKSELLVAATEKVLGEASQADTVDQGPEDAIRTLASAIFDAIDAHPWVGTELGRLPSQPAVLRVFERLGRRVQQLDVPSDAQFDCASALLSYVLGVATQNAANARANDSGRGRSEILEASTADLDPAAFPFLRGVAAQLRDHDDRAQFLAGIALLLRGMQGARMPSPVPTDPPKTKPLRGLRLSNRTTPGSDFHVAAEHD